MLPYKVLQNLSNHLLIVYFAIKINHARQLTRTYSFELKAGTPEKEFCRPAVIGHRGACGYMPEHTLACFALAMIMGADGVEPDLVATRDHQIIVRHDNELSTSTDVAEHPEFACRRKNKTINGTPMNGWFTEDFSLDEIKTLRAIERIPNIRPGNVKFNGIFQVITLEELIDLVKGLQQTLKRTVGLNLDIKHSSHFREIGLPLEQAVVNIIHKHGYTGPEAPIVLQSFEINCLKELNIMTDVKLMQSYDLPSIQPFDEISRGGKLTYKDMATPEGFREVAKYASCVGVEQSYIIPRRKNKRHRRVPSIVRDAHAAGLEVYVYTLCPENYFLPKEYHGGDKSPNSFGNFSEYLKVFYAAGIDGLFCDYPDLPLRFLR